MGKEKGADNKNSKSLRVKGKGLRIHYFFVVFGLLGAQVCKEKGKDNKITNPYGHLCRSRPVAIRMRLDKMIRFRSLHRFFLCRRPLPFGGSPLEAYPWTSGESNHHRQSVCVAKNDALPTEPRGHLA